MSKLDAIYRELAALALADGIPLDETPGGVLHAWILERCRIPRGNDFFVVVGVIRAMADQQAREEGYESQGDRAAKRAFAKYQR